jgi:hypothetical protein
VFLEPEVSVPVKETFGLSELEEGPRVGYPEAKLVDVHEQIWVA